MKVGIMSMQRVKNYGSFLQAYALKKTIEAAGHAVEFVDFERNAPIPGSRLEKSCINLKEQKLLINKIQ